MEDVLGGRTDPERFATYLADWEVVLARRVETAVAAFATVEGVVGLILAGGIGRGEPWPLSDIDLLPIYDDARMDRARVEIERRRVAMLAPWIAEGWWTGLDIGRLSFGRAEVEAALTLKGSALEPLMRDNRWYHAVDKGYGGQAAYDPEVLAAPLAQWFTTHRFRPEVVHRRLARDRAEVEAAENRHAMYRTRHDPAGATTEIRTAVKWLQTGLLELWGERDNSLGRIGTRFARLAHAQGMGTLVEELDALCDLDDAAVERRMAAAPDWVWERHDRSWRARRHISEAVTRLEDARDTLRVCTLYATRHTQAPPYPSWLAIPTEIDPLADKTARLTRIIGLWTAALL